MLQRVGVRIPLLLFVGFLALRIPFRAKFLINWDAVNFALGTQLFSLEHHQPHPPGYIGYIALGWLLNHFTGDANTSLTLVSVVSGAAAPAAFFLLASLFMPRRYALVTAVLFGLSPVVWYYSEVALTYSLELALALLFLWSGYRARQRVSVRHLAAATVLLILLGAMRQSGALFLMPLWLYIAWAFPWRRRVLGGAVLVGGNLAWLVPLLWLSGGIVQYFRMSAELAQLVVMPTSIFALNPLSMSQNVGYVFMGIIVGVNLGLVIIAAGFFLRVKMFARFAPHWIFFVLWLVPVLMTYLLLHTGQLGYVLLVLPAVFLLVGSALSGVAARRPMPALRTAAAGGRLLTRRHTTALIVTLLAVGNAGAFLLVPQAVHALARSMEADVAEDRGPDTVDSFPLSQLAAAEEGGGVANWARQYNVRENDTHWNSLIEFVKLFNPESTAILALPHLAGSFRHLTYYLPDYYVYGLGRDLEGSFGHLFTAHEGTSDYAVERLETAQQKLHLPADVQMLLIPDEEIYRRIKGVTLYTLELEGGAEVAIALVPRSTTLVFEDAGEDSATITSESVLGRDSTAP